MIKNTILIDFLGCKVNSYEVESLANIFNKRGYHFFDAKTEDSPEVIIINTCAVTETSVQKDRKMIRHYRSLYQDSILVVMGCYSQYQGKFILENLGANIVLGTSNRDKVYDLVQEFKEKHENVLLHDDHNSIKKYEEIELSSYEHNTRAYVKIQDGCNNFCTYCLIPYVRGRSRSRDPEDIVSEIKNLVKNGYKEVVLTGIDMSSYGLDLEKIVDFSGLIEKILVEIKDLYRLRISSIEESLLDEKFIHLLAEYPNFANHLHIPLQSGSRRIVELMNRKYDLDGFREKIKKIREVRPDISLTTDVIVGFPSETDAEFMETYDFCKEMRFSKIHVFPYSIREGTVAAKMKDQVSSETKKERVRKLSSLSNLLQEEYVTDFLDKDIEFLFESYNPKTDSYVGHSSNYLVVSFKSDEVLTNKIKKVKYNLKNKLNFWQCQNQKTRL